jgi:hypothetical protein
LTSIVVHIGGKVDVGAMDVVDRTARTQNSVLLMHSDRWCCFHSLKILIFQNY